MAIEPKFCYSDRAVTEGNPVPRQYRDFFAAIILRALADIMEESEQTIPYAWYSRRSGIAHSHMEHSNATTARASAMAWIFHSEEMSERPTYTLRECCEPLLITVESVQRHAALINKWTKLCLARGNSPNVADNLGRDKLLVDTASIRQYHLGYFK